MQEYMPRVFDKYLSNNYIVSSISYYFKILSILNSVVLLFRPLTQNIS